MNRIPGFTLFSIAVLLFSACGNANNIKNPETVVDLNTKDTLPPPFATKSVNNQSKVIGWKDGETPTAPAGFTVARFADSLDHPRWIYVADNGDIFVAESNTILKGLKKFGAKISRKIKTQNIGESAGRITMFRDADKNGVYETRHVFAEGFNQPLGMLIVKNHFYVAGTDGVWQYNYSPGMTQLDEKDSGKMIVELPAGGYNNHWTRNIITNKAQDKLYISVGSGSNVAEHGMENEIRRADILEVNLDGTGERIYGSGLRNPVGMAWAPGSNALWTAVNERDGLGDDLVPDYITSVKPGGFYGWPYSYFGQNPDPRMKDDPKPELVKTAIVPDVPLGSHTASLGLAFNTGNSFPAKYSNGAFVGQHGSWNRSVLSGYKVVFVPFSNGKPSGKPEDFLTGFIADAGKSEVRGRPVCTAFLADGSLLVTDDASNVIWRVSATR